MFSIKKNTLLFLIIILPIFVDQLNGFFIDRGIDISVSQFVKAVYLAVFVVVIARKLNYLLLYLCWFIVLLLGLLNASLVDSNHEPYKDIVFISKLLTLPLTYHCFCCLRSRISEFHNNYGDTIYLTLFATVFCALVLSSMGFGMSMYGFAMTGAGDKISLGYRGYFIAGNELSALFVLLYSFSYSYVYCIKKNFFSIIMVGLTGLLISLLIVTKTALLSFLLITLFVPIFQRLYIKQPFYIVTKSEKIFLKAFSAIVIVGILLGYFIFYDRMQANVDKIMFNYEKAGDLITVMTSGRNERIVDSLTLFSHDYNLREILFGTGWEYPQKRLIDVYLGDGAAEIDWLDLVVSIGVVGVAITYGFWLLVIRRSFLLFKNRVTVYSIPLLIASALLFINSFISGHIIYSSLLGLYLGYYSAMSINPLSVSR